MSKILDRDFLDSIIPGAKNFKYKELIISPTAVKHNIQNTPSEKEIEKLEILARKVLQPIRDQFGPIRISSGFRSKELNSFIGGSIFSNHVRGEAADLSPFRNIQIEYIMKWVDENLEFRNMIYEYGRWIHIDYRENANLKVIKVKTEDYNYKKINIQELFSISHQ